MGMKKTDEDIKRDELIKQNKFMKFILDSSAMVFLLLDKDYNLIYCSENVKKYVMLSDLSEIIGKPLVTLEKLIDDKNFAMRFYHNVKQVALHENAYIADEIITWPNGNKRLYRMENRRILDESGEFNGISCVMRDITDMRMEEEERLVKERLRLTQSPCMIWDENGVPVDCNAEALKFFGLPPDFPSENYGRIMELIQPRRQPPKVRLLE